MASGTVVNWACETNGPNGLIRAGWKRDSLKVGDQVTVDGYRAKDGSNMIDARLVTLPDGRKVFAGNSDDGGPRSKVTGFSLSFQIAGDRRSKQPFLLFQIAERPDIRDRKREPVLRIVTRAKVEAPVLHAEAAAVRVVGDLRDGEFLMPSRKS